MDDQLDDFAAYRQADVRFHVGLAEATGSPRLRGGDDRGPGRDDRPDPLHRPPARGAGVVQRPARPAASRASSATTRDAAMRIMAEHLRGTEHVLAGLLPSPGLTFVRTRRVRSAPLEVGASIPFHGRAGMAETQPEQQQPTTSDGSPSSATSRSLQRAWSAFSNFAISFTIISVLAGCFTTYGQAWNNGGPIAISWGWPIICGLILLVAFSMSELVSAYPTAGGIYYWASTLGGPGWGWFTGWFNLRRPGRRRRVGRLRRARSS